MLKHYLELPKPVYVLCLGTFINRAGTFLLPFLTLYLDRELGLGARFAGLGMSVYGMGALAGALVGGHLADRIGRRAVMIGALAGGALILCVFGSLRSPPMILAALAVFPLIGEMYRPAANAMIADLVPPERRAYAFGLMYVAINLGFAVGPATGGWIQERFSFVWLFWGDALTAGTYAFIILTLVRETIPPRSGAAVQEAGAHEHSAERAIGRVLRDRTFVLFCVATLLIGLGYVQCMATFPLFLDRERGMGGAAYGRIIALNGLLIVLFQIPLTAFLRRFNRASVVALSAAVAGLGLGATYFAQSEWQFMLTVAIWTLGEMMSAAFSAAIVSDLAPVALRARYMGAFSMCFSSATMLGAPLGGLIFEHWGSAALWGSCLAVAMLASLLYWGIHPRITATRQSGS